MFDYFNKVIEFLQNWQDKYSSYQSIWYDFLGVLVDAFAWISAIGNSFFPSNSDTGRLFMFIMPSVFVALVREWRKRNLG